MSSNSLTLSISVPIAMFVTFSRITSTTTGTRCSRAQRLRLSQRAGDLLGIGDAQRLAAEALDDGLVIDAVAARADLFGHVLVLERELHAVVHLEAALRLADQAEVRVVDQHLHVRQPELRADRELLDQELEVVVAGQPDDGARRVGRDARRAPPGSSSRAGRPGRS